MRPFEIGARTLRRLDWFARGAGYWPGAGGLAGTDSARPIGNICCGILPGFGVVALILDHLVGQPLQHRSHAVSSTATPRSVGPGHRIAGRCGRCWGSEGQDHSRPPSRACTGAYSVRPRLTRSGEKSLAHLGGGARTARPMPITARQAWRGQGAVRLGEAGARRGWQGRAWHGEAWQGMGRRASKPPLDRIDGGFAFRGRRKSEPRSDFLS
jgi:hypothetical protein